MTTQIAVRLPDAVVAFLDDAVASGAAPSRAALVTSAVEREMRRLLAERDAEILARVGTTDDLDPLVWWTPAHGAIDSSVVVDPAVVDPAVVDPAAVDEAVADADPPALDG